MAGRQRQIPQALAVTQVTYQVKVAAALEFHDQGLVQRYAAGASTWKALVTLAPSLRPCTHVGQVSTLVSEISAASSEQSTGVSRAGDAVSQIDQVTQQNAALVEECAAAADNLTRQAQGLVEAGAGRQAGRPPVAAP